MINNNDKSDNEIWKGIERFNGVYWVSNLGRIKNKHEKILKPSVVGNDGPKIGLCYRSNFKKTYQLHYIVARTFIPNPDNKRYVVHKDGNKLNNQIDNLIWSDIPYHVYHNWEKSRKIIQSDLKGKKIKEFPSIASASRETYISNSSIYANCTGRTKKAGNFIWRYKEK